MIYVEFKVDSFFSYPTCDDFMNDLMNIVDMENIRNYRNQLINDGKVKRFQIIIDDDSEYGIDEDGNRKYIYKSLFRFYNINDVNEFLYSDILKDTHNKIRKSSFSKSVNTRVIDGVTEDL